LRLPGQPKSCAVTKSKYPTITLSAKGQCFLFISVAGTANVGNREQPTSIIQADSVDVVSPHQDKWNGINE
jgi:hypothetical protein